MILSASRRTDIPALYSDWFFEQLKAGYFLVPSPFIKNDKIAKIDVAPVKIEKNIMGGVEITGNIDGIMFWTKNPRPMLKRLDELKDYKYCFLFTLNPYDVMIEKDLPSLDERIKSFHELSNMIGEDRVMWRYDPILFANDIDIKWHIEQFKNLASQLEGCTKCCKTSFLIGKHPKIFTPSFSEQVLLVKTLASIAKEHGITIETCADPKGFEDLGIKKSSCIDPLWWDQHLNAKRKSKKLDGQRKECLCMQSVDIGIYNTCTHNCIYCYANGFCGFRGEPKTMLQDLNGEIYERKIERLFNY